MKLFLILTVIIVSIARADDWDARYAELCSRDNYCTELRAKDGSWNKPKPEVLAFIKDKKVQEEIQNTAKRMGVDPVAVAGAVLAENSLNVDKKNGYIDYLTFGKKNDLENYLASKGVTSLPGKGQFSFGFGQIHLDTAEAAEKHAAELEHRAPRSTDQLRVEILDPLGSIRVAGEIIRKVQDDYKSQGFDISKDPGILTTLYNLGDSERRAKEAKDNNKPPQPNYFGVFVQRYQSQITVAVGSTNAPTSVSDTVDKSTKSPPAEKPENPNLSATAKAKTVAAPAQTSTFIKANYVTQTLPLIAAPQLCDREVSGQDIQEETRQSSYGAPVGSIEKGESYTEVSRALDCKANAWTLVRSSSGVLGWVKEDRIEGAHSSRYEPPKKCNGDSANSTCRMKIENSAGNLKVDSTSADNLLYLKPVSRPDAPKAGFQNEDENCGFNSSTSRASRKSKFSSSMGFSFNTGGMKSNAPPASELPVDQLKAMELDVSKKLDAELKRLSSQGHISPSDLFGPQNPYNEIAKSLRMLNMAAQECLSQLSAEFYYCKDPRTLKDALEKLEKTKYVRDPDFDQVSDITSRFNADSQQFYMGETLASNAYTPSKEELASISAKSIKDSLSSCQVRVQKVETEAAKAPPAPAASASMNQGYVGTGYSMGQMGSLSYGDPNEAVANVFAAADKATEEQITKYKKEFITFAKVCHARLNLLSQPDKKDTGPYCIPCTQTPKNLTMDNYKILNKEMMAKLFQNHPDKMNDALKKSLAPIIDQSILDEINPQVPSSQQQAMLPTNLDKSYCPNKTVEYIENLLQFNPCIQRIYVPTRYLSNALSGFNGKVIYRQFEEGDRYAIDFGGNSCK